MYNSRKCVMTTFAVELISSSIREQNTLQIPILTSQNINMEWGP